jgi:hypothetical protein
MRAPIRLRGALIGAAVIGLGLLTGTAASLARAPQETEPPAVLPQEHTPAAYDAATIRFTGRLGAGGVDAAQALPGPSAVLVAVRGSDLVNCEDLGRQLRELSRAVPEGWGMGILVDAPGQEALAKFLTRERIRGVPVFVADPAALLADGSKVATPAALVAGRDGVVRAGVSHPSRFRNVRSRSFAQELSLDDPGSR